MQTSPHTPDASGAASGAGAGAAFGAASAAGAGAGAGAGTPTKPTRNPKAPTKPWAAVARILAQYVLTLLAASLVVFAVLRIAPGNPAEVALGVNAKPENIDALSAEMGFDRPWYEQYFSWLGQIFRGDFGMSLASQSAIGEVLFDRLAVSLILASLAMILALALATPAGMWAARRRRNLDGHVVTALSQLGLAVPSFLAGVLFIAFFGIHLGWLPTGGWVVPADDFGAFVRHIVLPVAALGLVQAAILTRYVRSQTLEVLHTDFMRTSRAMGASRTAALRRHGLRNIAPSVVTTAAVQFANLLVGAVVIEKVFVIPGIGNYLLQGVVQRDLPVVQAVMMVLVFVALTCNMLVDATLKFVDPRTRVAAGRK